MFLDDAAYHLSSPSATITYKLPINPQLNSLQAKAKKMMQMEKKNMRKSNFKKAVTEKFREYDQKLEALTNFNVSKAFEKVVQAKVMIEMKKLLPTYIPTVVANYVRPRLKTSVLEQTLDAQDAKPSFYKRSHNNQVTLNDCEGEKRKKQRKDVGQYSSRSSRQNTSLVKEKITILDLEGAGLEKLKQQYKNDVDLEYHIDQLKVAMLSKANWNSDADDVSKPKLFEIHMSKNTKPRPSFYNNNFYYIVSLSMKEKYTTSITNQYASRYYKQGIEDMISKRWCKETHRYHFEALNDLRINLVVRIVIKKKWGYGFLTSIEVRRSEDPEFEKIQENLIDMVTKNKLGKGNKRFKGRDWTDNNVVKSNEMVKKINRTLKRQRAAQKA
ncbi:hypothetical protein Tco_0987634 [Tanacetum coccineum]